MKFSDLENVPIYTILTDERGDKRYFYGFTLQKEKIILSWSDDPIMVMTLKEDQIKNWTIVKESKKIYQHYFKVRHGANVETAIDERTWEEYIGDKDSIRRFWEHLGTKEITFE